MNQFLRANQQDSQQQLEKADKAAKEELAAKDKVSSGTPTCSEAVRTPNGRSRFRHAHTHARIIGDVCLLQVVVQS